MAGATSLEARFVEFVPEVLEEGILYVSIEYGTVVHLCACGCRSQSVTPLGPSEYRITYDGETITLRPSVGNWGFACRSHYTIDQGRVTWADSWTDAQVERNRARDREAKAALYGTPRAVGVEPVIIKQASERRADEQPQPQPRSRARRIAIWAKEVVCRRGRSPSR